MEGEGETGNGEEQTNMGKRGGVGAGNGQEWGGESGEVEAERERPGELDWEGGNGEKDAEDLAMVRSREGSGKG